ncbi:MAG: CcmD family protein [Desulfovibrionaceae bacterium]|nr:CcmD family protein [Desulfovibrionaceae bacterium]
MTEPWVLYSGIAVWLGIGAYTVFLALGQARLRRKIFQLEQLLKDNTSSDNASS